MASATTTTTTTTSTASDDRRPLAVCDRLVDPLPELAGDVAELRATRELVKRKAAERSAARCYAPLVAELKRARKAAMRLHHVGSITTIDTGEESAVRNACATRSLPVGGWYTPGKHRGVAAVRGAMKLDGTPRARAWLGDCDERDAYEMVDTCDLAAHDADGAVLRAAEALRRFVETELAATNDAYVRHCAALKTAMRRADERRAEAMPRWGAVRVLNDLCKQRPPDQATCAPRERTDALVTRALAAIEEDLAREGVAEPS